MSFYFRCHHCGTELEAEDEWRDLDAACPNCQQRLHIPRAPRRMEPSASSDVFGKSAGISSRTGKKWYFGGVCMILLGAVIAGGGYYYARQLRMAEEQSSAERQSTVDESRSVEEQNTAEEQRIAAKRLLAGNRRIIDIAAEQGRKRRHSGNRAAAAATHDALPDADYEVLLQSLKAVLNEHYITFRVPGYYFKLWAEQAVKAKPATDEQRRVVESVKRLWTLHCRSTSLNRQSMTFESQRQQRQVSDEMDHVWKELRSMLLK